MANLQYIGARYVPILFTNPDDQTCDWKAGVTYEALTIVTYNDDSYTSKKAVPESVGNPADNPEYWVKTGNFNASLIALQNEVNSIEDNIGEESPITENSTINDALYKAAIECANAPAYNLHNVFSAYKKTYLDTLTSTSGKSIQVQGVAYDSYRNRLCYALVNVDDTTEGWLVEVDPDDHTTIINSKHFTADELGHAAPMAYDADGDRFVTLYFESNKIRTYSASTLGYIEEIDPALDMSDNNIMRGITYDTDSKKFYAVTYVGMYIFDESFTLEDYPLFDFNLKDIVTAPSIYLASHALNGFTYYNNNFYVNIMRSEARSRINYIYKFNRDMKCLSNYDISNASNCFEFEDMTAYDNGLHAFGSFDVFTDYKLCEAPERAGNGLLNQSNGLTIPANSTIGTYAFDNGRYCYRGDKSLTMTDAPFEGDTTIISVPLASRQIQIAIGGHNAKPRIAMRSFSNSNDTWTAWTSPTIENLVYGTTRTINQVFGGYVDADGNLRISCNGFTFSSNAIRNASTIETDGTVRFVDGSTLTLTNDNNTDPYLKADAIWFRQRLTTPLTSLANTPLSFDGSVTITVANST